MFRLSELFAGSGKSASYSFGGVFLSPIWTAVVIVTIILIIVWFVTRNEIEPKYDDTSIWTLLIKIGVWSLIGTACVQWLSASAIEASVAERYTNKNQREIVHNALDSEAGEGALIPN
jgi:type VI protein secretion system component VasK